jgi:hypothetical protein
MRKEPGRSSCSNFDCERRSRRSIKLSFGATICDGVAGAGKAENPRDAYGMSLVEATAASRQRLTRAV